MKLYVWKLLTIRNSVNVVAINKSVPRRPVLEIKLCCHLIFWLKLCFCHLPFFHLSSFYFTKLLVILVKFNIRGLAPWDLFPVRSTSLWRDLFFFFFLIFLHLNFFSLLLLLSVCCYQLRCLQVSFCRGDRGLKQSGRLPDLKRFSGWLSFRPSSSPSAF